MAKPTSESTSYPDAIILCGRALASRTSCISPPHRVQDAAFWAHLLHTFETLRCIYSWESPPDATLVANANTNPPMMFPGASAAMPYYFSVNLNDARRVLQVITTEIY